MAPDDRERALLDLDCPPAWPAKLLGYLDEHHDLFLGRETRRSLMFSSQDFPVVSGQDSDKGHDFEEAIHGLREALQPYEILGWHYTRLTDAEADEILQNGMQLSSVEMLERRINAVVRTGEIPPGIAQHLKRNNRVDEEGYAGKIWFCFFPPANADEGAIERFFRHWGGEALYACHEHDPLTSPAISCIGTPCIAEAYVPIASLSKHW